MLNIIAIALYAALSAILPPCQAEDAPLCHWSASSAGNGLGTSFVSLDTFAITSDGIVID